MIIKFCEAVIQIIQPNMNDDKTFLLIDLNEYLNFNFQSQIENANNYDSYVEIKSSSIITSEQKKFMEDFIHKNKLSVMQ